VRGETARALGEDVEDFRARRSRAPVLLLWLAIAVVVLIGGVWIARRVGESGSEALAELL